VVLDRPDLVEAQRLGELGDSHLVTNHVVIASAAEIVLKDEQDADVHDAHLCVEAGPDEA
jgi:hypothetical protein